MSFAARQAQVASCIRAYSSWVRTTSRCSQQLSIRHRSISASPAREVDTTLESCSSWSGSTLVRTADGGASCALGEAKVRADRRISMSIRTWSGPEGAAKIAREETYPGVIAAASAVVSVSVKTGPEAAQAEKGARVGQQRDRQMAKMHTG